MVTRNSDVDKRKYILENFGRAMQENWIEVFYQPIIRTSSGHVCGEEALVRWDDPIFGVMNPDDFVPILEAVNLIDRLDLYVLEQCLAKIKRFRELGMYTVVHSINLSQIDFFSGDIVGEVKNKVEESGVSPSLIAIDISEKICVNNEQIVAQLEKFKDAGFKVWMDDYGCGDFAPVLLQKIQFDILKINISMVSRLNDSESTRIIITELVRMAMALGIEVAAEGVENEEQVEFLNEIGCAKLQGFYYCKPISTAEILERYRTGKQIGFENPDELDYYTTVGHVSLYDLSFAGNEEGQLSDYFDTFPMAILQVDADKVSLMRCNKTFRSFFYANVNHKRGVTTIYFKDEENKVGYYAMTMLRQCATDGKRLIVDERTKNGKTVQLLFQKIADNSVTGMVAVVIVVLSVTERPDTNDDLSYNYIARALAEDYMKLFFVDMRTNAFVEYAPDGKNRDVSVVGRGDDFFQEAKDRAYSFIYKQDRERFIKSFSKDQILRDLKEYGKYTLTYRTMMDMVPTYVNLKAVRVRTDDRHILIGITNVDAQTRQQEAYDRIKEEKITYNRISALSSDFLNIYTVDPKTGFYELFKTTASYQQYELDSEGRDFFKESTENLKKIIHKDDLPGFLKVFNKEHILNVINAQGLFAYSCRIMMDNAPVYVTMKAAIVEEMDGPRLIFGLINIDDQVRKEMEYANSLSEAEDKAVRDELTGVKNKHAYALAEEEYNVKIESKSVDDFAIVVCDLNGLKDVNDTLGHQMGDQFIKAGCKIICTTFAHSPVYRVGGDEFVAIVRGSDYENLDNLVETMDKVNKRNQKKGEVTIAVGFARYNGQSVMSEIFDEADAKMYLNKKHMKNDR